MASNQVELSWRWDSIKESLVSLYFLHKSSSEHEEILNVLREDKVIQNMNLQTFNSIMYFIFGIINKEGRDQLIKWPIINIQAQAQFRKGILTLVNNAQVKYPWANVQAIPASYFKNPRGDQVKILDFILYLTTLASHISLDEDDLLLMSCDKDSEPKDLQVAYEVMCIARKQVENDIERNRFDISEFEEIKQDIVNKCLELKQRNSELQHDKQVLEKKLKKKQLLKENETLNINTLKKINQEKLQELQCLNEELSKYNTASCDTVSKMLAAKNMSSLSTSDFGWVPPLDLREATNVACDNVNNTFEQIKQKQSSVDEEKHFLENLKQLKKSMIEERDCMQSFLSTMTPQTQIVDKDTNSEDSKVNFDLDRLFI